MLSGHTAFLLLVAAGATPKAPVSPLERGIALLDKQEHEQALAALETAAQRGPYSYDQVVALYKNLGIARAFAGDDTGARRAFEQMLAVAPLQILSYTLSPKATFVFERARSEMKDLRATEFRIRSEPVVPLDHQIEIELECLVDNLQLIRRAEVLYRLQGNLEYGRVEVSPPTQGSTVEVRLPPVASAEVAQDADGVRGTMLELALVGYDERGWEVYRGPHPDRPQVVAVGFDAQGPWHTRWYTWALIGGGVLSAAAVAAGIAIAVHNQPLPDEAGVSYEVIE